MNRRRFVLFAVTAIVLALLVSTAAVVAADVYLHRKYADLVGLNVWGYRGPVVGRKQPNEWRLLVLGESTAFGYGVRWDEAVPAYLEKLLNDSPTPGGRHVTVVNLAFNNQGAHSYKYEIGDYAYLHADAVLFYSGYNDLSANSAAFRHSSPIFRATGYLPLLPMIVREKAMSMRYRNLDDAYTKKKTTFKPNITARATASALEAAVSIEESLENQFTSDSLQTVTDEAATEGTPCGPYWAHYCGEMYESIKLALSQGQRVLQVTQPSLKLRAEPMKLHEDQQKQLHTFLHQKFGDDPRIRFAAVSDAVDLGDPSLCYDGLHLTAKGNRIIAAALAPAVRDLMR